MRFEDLISITKLCDSDHDPERVGSLDYGIHSTLADWLAVDIEKRTAEMVAELRDIAGKLERGESPFIGTLETARERATEMAKRRDDLARRIREREMRSVP